MRRWLLLALLSIPVTMAIAAVVSTVAWLAGGLAANRGAANRWEHVLAYSALAGAVPSLAGWVKWVSGFESLGWSRWSLILLWPIVGAVSLLVGAVLAMLIAWPWILSNV